MTSVERVKQILKERGIKMAPFEKQCGFSNGYIGKLKEGFPDERLFIVADQLGVDPRWLVFGVSKDSEAEMQKKKASKPLKIAVCWLF